MTLQTGPNFKRLVANKDRLPAAEWNKLTERMELLLRSHPQLAFASSGGLSFRRQPIPADASATHATIVSTLQRADTTVDPPLEERDYYEIQIVGANIEDWSENYGTYPKDMIVKHASKLWVCKVEHTARSTREPGLNSTYWEESEYTQAWVWGYSGSLLEAVPWIQVGEYVEVINYQVPGQTGRDWWILNHTPTRVQDGTDYSIMWDDNGSKSRAKAVFG